MSTSEAGTRTAPQASRPGAEDIAREVRSIIAERCGMSLEAVRPELSLESGLGVDSLALIEINVALEERFQIAAPDFAAPGDLGIDTVGDVIAFVEAEVAKQGGRGGAQ